MNTLQTEAEITADGSVKLLSPLPAWLKPGRAQIILTLKTDPGETTKPPRQKLVATPEMVEAREAALEEIRRLDPFRDIADPVAWQREIRKDRPLPGRD